MTLFFRLFFVAALFLSGCTEVPSTKAEKPARILAMGDSMLAWNSAGRGSVSHSVEKHLGEAVIDRSVSGARILYALPVSGSLGLRISSQFLEGDWDWVILNGGGNDLWLGCGCNRCDHQIERLISQDATKGHVPALVRKIRQTKAKVIYLGYLRTPGRESPIEACTEIGDTFENRLSQMAKRDSGVFFVSNRDLVPYGDLSFHSLDRIHPSAKGSFAIGARAARVIVQNDR